ncbi:MAG: hybrid sensor histidine kinase/response regulator, partial [Polyangiaceae bacterium]
SARHRSCSFLNPTGREGIGTSNAGVTVGEKTMQGHERRGDLHGFRAIPGERGAPPPPTHPGTAARFESLQRSEEAAHARARQALVVDDDLSLRDTLCETLRLLGYQTSYCDNGRTALALLRGGERPDVILLDLQMPAMSGWEFRVEQRKDPELATIPVVVLSADTTPMAAAIDADAYLAKPVGLEMLASTLERVLLQRENRELQARLLEADRLRSLGTLAAGVAHEINNPLCFVGLNIGFVRDKLRALSAEAREGEADEVGPSARDAALEGEMLEALDSAQLGVERIGAIVRGLKTFSHPDDAPVTPVDLPKLLDSTLAILKHEIEGRAMLLLEYEDVPIVEVNGARLSQVFLNLLLNAAQAFDSPAAGNEVRVRVRSAPPQVIVEIRDNGCGIPEHVREHVFEPFVTTKPVGVGTGLGLSICHGIVRSLHGELTFETQIGKGTVFRVALPAAAPPQATGGGT